MSFILDVYVQAGCYWLSIWKFCAQRSGWYLEKLLDIELGRKSRSCDSENILNRFNEIDKSELKEEKS